MVFDVSDCTYTQNKNKFYVGDINTDENVKFKCDYIIVGNINTNGMLIATESLVVMGDIKAPSIFVNKDLFCTGTVVSESIDVDGQNIILEKIAKEKVLIPNPNIEETIVEQLYSYVRCYGYEKEAIKFKSIKGNKYYIDLKIKEKHSNKNFLEHINQAMKFIGEKLNNKEINIDFDEDTKGLISKLLGTEVKNLEIEEDNIIKIKLKVEELDCNQISKNKTILEELLGYTIDFYSDKSYKEESENKEAEDVEINNLIQNINEVLSKKNKDKIEIFTNNKRIRFEQSEINSCELENKKVNMVKHNFYYVKYNEKIYINPKNILDILELDKFYTTTKLVEHITINYTDDKEKRIDKFYKLHNYYNFLIEISKNYKKLNINKNTLLCLYKAIYNLDIKSHEIKESVPFWNKILQTLTKNTTEGNLKEEFKISDNNFQEIKKGYKQSKSISKALIKSYIKHNNENISKKHNSDESKIENVVYDALAKSKYNLNQINIQKIKNEKDNVYTVYIESKHCSNKALKIISDKINLANKEYIISLELYEANNISKIISKYNVNLDESKTVIKRESYLLKNRKEFIMGEDIEHKTYGNGTVTKVEANYVTIRFKDCEKKFDLDFLINKKLVKRLVY